jgi:hypothetical protein
MPARAIVCSSMMDFTETPSGPTSI